MLSADLGHYDVLRTLAPRASSYLEVGTYRGGSLRAVIESHPEIERVTCCDSWVKTTREGLPPGHAHIEVLLAELGYHRGVRFLDGASAVLIPQMSAVARFDLSVVDADHAHEAALLDLRNVWARTRWAMVVHDVWLKAGVRSALRQFIAELPAATASCQLCAGDHGTAVLFRRDPP